MDFGEFLNRFGLKSFPFNTFTTEDEKQAGSLFVEPIDYTLIKDAFRESRTIIMSGNRGTGKTAIIYDLIRNSKENSLICYIDDYSSIKIKSELQDFYEMIASQLVNTLVGKCITKQKEISHLSKEDKVFFSYLFSKFVTSVTKERINEEIEKIQLSQIRRTLKKGSAFIRFCLNYGLTAASKLINSTISSHFYMLPTINENEVKDILPELKFSVDNHFIDLETSYSFILRICTLITRLNFTNITIFLDKIDEDSRFINDSEVISDFIAPLLTDNKLLLNPSIQIYISIWAVPFNMLKDNVRTQKYYCPSLTWKNDDLIKAFNRRIEVYSETSGRKFDEFFDMDVTEVDKNLILHLANHNPRDLWHIFNNLFHEQYAIDSTTLKITKDAITRGLKNFVSSFNFYEYYPRKKGSRSDSMDVYKYINHLLKLSDTEFTANQLNEEAGTGGSTSNYLAGMQGIGLVYRTDKKRSAGVVYKIADPKIEYALKENIKIARI